MNVLGSYLKGVQSREADNGLSSYMMPRDGLGNSTPMAMEFAARNLGMNETDQREALSTFMETGGAGMDPATAAWCAAYVNASLGHAGIEGTGKMTARSFLDWGTAVDTPQVGDIAVFSRGDPNGWQGHVGFFAGYNPDGTVKVLGGNQNDGVGYGSYSTDRLLGYRRAPTTRVRG